MPGEGGRNWHARATAFWFQGLVRQQWFNGFPEVVGAEWGIHDAEASSHVTGFCNTL